MNNRMDGDYAFAALCHIGPLPTEGATMRHLHKAIFVADGPKLGHIADRILDALDREAIRISGGFVE